jgi:hypothetical protein
VIAVRNNVTGIVAGLLLVAATVSCLSALNRRSEERIAATADNRAEIGSSAGRDSTIWNVSFQDVTGKAGWLAPTAVVAGGWWVSRRKLRGGIRTCVTALEYTQCEDCQRCVERANNAVINKEVARMKKRLGKLRGGQRKPFVEEAPVDREPDATPAPPTLRPMGPRS